MVHNTWQDITTLESHHGGTRIIFSCTDGEVNCIIHCSLYKVNYQKCMLVCIWLATVAPCQMMPTSWATQRSPIQMNEEAAFFSCSALVCLSTPLGRQHTPSQLLVEWSDCTTFWRWIGGPCWTISVTFWDWQSNSHTHFFHLLHDYYHINKTLLYECLMLAPH